MAFLFYLSLESTCKNSWSCSSQEESLIASICLACSDAAFRICSDPEFIIDPDLHPSVLTIQV